jgi:hypothetical protein
MLLLFKINLISCHMKQVLIRAPAATNIAQMEPLIPEAREMAALLELASRAC